MVDEDGELDAIITRLREIHRWAEQAEQHPTAHRQAMALLAELRELIPPDGAEQKPEKFDLHAVLAADQDEAP